MSWCRKICCFAEYLCSIEIDMGFEWTFHFCRLYIRHLCATVRVCLRITCVWVPVFARYDSLYTWNRVDICHSKNELFRWRSVKMSKNLITLNENTILQMNDALISEVLIEIFNYNVVMQFSKHFSIFCPFFVILFIFLISFHFIHFCYWNSIHLEKIKWLVNSTPSKRLYLTFETN